MCTMSIVTALNGRSRCAELRRATAFLSSDIDHRNCAVKLLLQSGIVSEHDPATTDATTIITINNRSVMLVAIVDVESEDGKYYVTFNRPAAGTGGGSPVVLLAPVAYTLRIPR